MEHMIALSVLLIIGAVASVLVLRRTARPEPADRTDGLAAEAEAHHWVVRLGDSLIIPDARIWAGADEGTGRELSYATACHRDARQLLTGARTPAEYDEAARVARDGLRHMNAARRTLGLDQGAPA